MKRFLSQLPIPLLLLGIPLFISWQSPDLTGSSNEILQAFLIILPIAPFVAFATCIFMGFRYNNGGLIYSAILFTATYTCFSARWPLSPTTPLSMGFILCMPVNLIFFSHQFRRRIFTTIGLIILALLCLEILAIFFLLGRPLYEDTGLWLKLEQLLPHLATYLSQASRFGLRVTSSAHPHLPILVYAASGLYLIVRIIRDFDPRLSGYIGGLAGLYATLLISTHPNLIMLTFTMIGAILIITSVEASFSMAYYDELTGLPGRRSLNEAMSNLSGTYAIGMMDIDHFKKFNDTYGHKVGDDVLRMVASKLAKTTGRAKVFRYGGEEFTAVFSGKTAEEAVPHLEKLRKTIAKSMFKVRSKTRKTSSAKDRGKKKHKNKEVSVTISIGVVNNSRRLNTPEKVIKESDKILYKAKNAGRNCVKTG